jgi:hypothetical protein
LPGPEVRSRVPERLLQSRFGERGVDDLPVAGLVPVRAGGQDPDDAEQPGVDVGDRVARFHW